MFIYKTENIHCSFEDREKPVKEMVGWFGEQLNMRAKEGWKVIDIFSVNNYGGAYISGAIVLFEKSLASEYVNANLDNPIR